METLQGRRSADGVWVGYGDAAVVQRLVATGEVAEFVTPRGGVVRTTVARAGRAFERVPGERIAYAYPATPVAPNIAPRTTRRAHR